MSTEDRPGQFSGVSRIASAIWGLLIAIVVLNTSLSAGSGRDAWLRYDPVDQKTAQERYADLPAVVVALGNSDVIQSAHDELIRGVRGMLGQTLRIETKPPKESFILLGTYELAKKAIPTLENMPDLTHDGFWLKTIQLEGRNCLVIAAPNDRGVLHGVFAVLRKVALGQSIMPLNEQHEPFAPLRLLNQFDRLDGTLSHGEMDGSIFWEAGHVAKDLSTVRDYARLLSSVGINGVSINHPGAGPRVVTSSYLDELARVAAVLRPWGIRLYIGLNSISPPRGGEPPRSRSGAANSAGIAASHAWNQLVEEIYLKIPDFGGFVLHADWGGYVEAPAKGPDRVAAINEIAAALQPHGGVIFCRTCRCQVEVDSADATADPAKAAYDLFQPLDGQFADNVVLQIKHGPMDFQVREPPSPLFGGLENTNQAIELQITQQYLGQQRHLCFLVPMWKEVLEFNMHAGEGDTPIKQLVGGKTFNRPLGGFVAISNVGRADNWMGHDLALANVYGFGRIAWDPNLTSKAIAEEWTRLTFGHDPLVVGALVDMLLKSWRIYESYTGPLGAGSLTDMGGTHYGPGIESADSPAWAPWHSADQSGIGKDRTAATGTGYVSQYRPRVAEQFESLEACPDALVLFMHHVPYTHTLDSGKTVIQHIYDVHYQGARDATRLIQQWQSLKGRIDDERYEAVLSRLNYQAGHATVWRDAVCNWFLQKSGIADNEGRIGNYPNRFEAEVLTLEGYEPQNVTPWETASGGQCAQCVDPGGKGDLSLKFEGKPGWYQIDVAYFDENDGASKFRLLIAGQLVDEWAADDLLPDNKPNGHTSTRHQTARIALRPGDEIRIEATTDGGERAPIDYLEIEASGN
jgi:alpha-glucuronidase